jgi:putative hydrolase of the HAD superfamily
VVQAIIFDGDDTLWQTEWLYDEARTEARQIVAETGLDGDAWEVRERLIDVENVARFGHSTNRFPTSCIEAYEEACAEAGKPADSGISERIGAVAQTVFERRAPLIEGAQRTLEGLRSSGIALALLTKGDSTVQRRRLDQSGLAPLFDLVDIVEEKTPESILSVLERLGVPVSAGLTVGNSVRSDILPSLAAGVTPVWIDAHVWEYERDHSSPPQDRVIKKQELSELLQMLSQ